MVTPEEFRQQLNACSGDIDLYLDSPGGDAFAGNAIYDALRQYSAQGRGRITAKVSLAASAASVIAMAADEIQISIVGTIMIHDPWSALHGNADQLRATANILDEIRDGQIQAYMRKTGRTRDEILTLIRGDGTYMNARTAMELGFADSIMHAEDGDSWVQALNEMRVCSCAALDMDRLRTMQSKNTERDGAARALMLRCFD